RIPKILMMHYCMLLQIIRMYVNGYIYLCKAGAVRFLNVWDEPMIVNGICNGLTQSEELFPKHLLHQILYQDFVVKPKRNTKKLFLLWNGWGMTYRTCSNTPNVREQLPHATMPMMCLK